jgi:hypothetical protein
MTYSLTIWDKNETESATKIGKIDEKRLNGWKSDQKVTKFKGKK